LIENSDVAEKIEAFLHHQMTVGELVDWCEAQRVHPGFQDDGELSVREVVSKIGEDEVRVFGLSWEDCEEMLSQLGYSVEMRLVPME
jgi:hypothetical protein